MLLRTIMLTKLSFSERKHGKKKFNMQYYLCLRIISRQSGQFVLRIPKFSAFSRQGSVNDKQICYLFSYSNLYQKLMYHSRNLTSQCWSYWIQWANVSHYAGPDVWQNFNQKFNWIFIGFSLQSWNHTRNFRIEFISKFISLVEIKMKWKLQTEVIEYEVFWDILV